MQSNKAKRMALNPFNFDMVPGPPPRTRTGPNPTSDFRFSKAQTLAQKMIEAGFDSLWEFFNSLKREQVADYATMAGMRVKSKTSKKIMIEWLIAKQED